MPAVVFDMDGLLIDSEPLWHEAERAVFATAGILLTREQCLETTGLRVDAVVAHWGAPAHLAEEIVNRVIALVHEKGTAKPGAHQAVALCKDAGLPMALASSSSLRIIHAVLDRLHMRFDVVHSAENEAFGKPHPAVYLSTAKLLNIAPVKCVAIEDSPAGVRSAKAAGMACIAVPDMLGGVAEADVILPSLLALDLALLKRLAP